MEEHRAVAFDQYILSNLDYVVRRHPEDVAIECCVMEFTQRYTVRHYRYALRMTVWQDVGRLE